MFNILTKYSELEMSSLEGPKRNIKSFSFLKSKVVKCFHLHCVRISKLCLHCYVYNVISNEYWVTNFLCIYIAKVCTSGNQSWRRCTYSTPTQFLSTALQLFQSIVSLYLHVDLMPWWACLNAYINICVISLQVW